MNKPILATLSLAALALPGLANATLFNRGSGLIYDDVLKITWLQDANYAKTSGYDSDGVMNWSAANTWAANLVYAGYSDWRLPTMVDTGGTGCDWAYTGTDCGFNVQTTSGSTVYSEMASLFYDTLGNKGWSDASGNLTGCSSNPPWCLTKTGPFANVQSNRYWSALEYAPDPIQAWFFDFGFGHGSANDEVDTVFAWAVRPGDVTSQVPEPGAQVPEPGVTLLLGFGLAGMVGVRRRARRPLGASVI